MKRAFTLIEVLTVIAIFGILASLGTYGYGVALGRSRDNQRLSDLQNIKNALEQYYLDNRQYPFWERTNEASFSIARWQLGEEFDDDCPHDPVGGRQPNQVYLAPVYLATIPEDPIHKLEFDQSQQCVLAEGLAVDRKQFGQYLYASLPDAGDAGLIDGVHAKSPATGYMLIARLERTTGRNIIPDQPASHPWPAQRTTFYAGRAPGILFQYGDPYQTHNYQLKSGRNN